MSRAGRRRGERRFTRREEHLLRNAGGTMSPALQSLPSASEPPSPNDGGERPPYSGARRRLNSFIAFTAPSSTTMRAASTARATHDASSCSSDFANRPST